MAFARRAVASTLSRGLCSIPRSPRRTVRWSLEPSVGSLRAPAAAGGSIGVRWHSAPATQSKVYEFDQVKQISESPKENQILIDVREPSEYQDGYIPNAINIPIKSQPDALFLPSEEFEERFGFSKPAHDTEVVFYCKSGVRSSAAANFAQQLGYKNVVEYRGSWLDWQKNGGTAAK